MIQSQPKLGDFVSLSDTYILVSGHCKRQTVQALNARQKN